MGVPPKWDQPRLIKAAAVAAVHGVKIAARHIGAPSDKALAVALSRAGISLRSIRKRDETVSRARAERKRAKRRKGPPSAP